MHDPNNQLDRSKQAHQDLLDDVNENPQHGAAQPEPYNAKGLNADELPARKDDEIIIALRARQQRLERLKNMDALAERARQRVMAGARAEFAALMQQLNVDTPYPLATSQGKRALEKMPAKPLLNAAREDGKQPQRDELAEPITENEYENV
jgi:hypothetical protein